MPGSSSAADSSASRHSRARKSWQPLAPLSNHSASCSGGPRKSEYIRTVSAPKRSTSSSGEITLPFDLAILAPR